MSGFDRIRPPERGADRAADPDGRAALFSPAGPGRPAGGGTLAAHCSRCAATTALDARTVARAAFPLFLVAPWRRHAFFAVCPACRSRAWLRVGGWR